MPEHHLTCRLHQTFSMWKHANLVIDLFYPDPEMAFANFSSDYNCLVGGEGKRIPLCIGGPLLLLRRRQVEEINSHTETFLTNISGRPCLNPTPISVNCEICRETCWLTQMCQTYEEMEERWCSKSTTWLFEIFKEVLSRLQQRLFLVSSLHYAFVKAHAYYHPKGFRLAEEELDLQGFEVFRRVQAFHVVADSRVRDLYTDVFDCVMSNVIRMLRVYAANELGFAEEQSAPSFIFRAINQFPGEMVRAMTGLGASLAPRLIALNSGDFASDQDRHIFDAADRTDLYVRNAVMCMRSLMVMNMTEPFDVSAHEQVREAYAADPSILEYVNAAVAL